MENEKSAGTVVFREYGGRKYLLLLYEGGYWDFPKGHVEPGERDEKTALRELREETGISRARLIGGFEEHMEYFYKRDGRLVHKDVVFFLAKTRSEKITISREHKDAGWFTYEEAMGRLKFRNAKIVLRKAEKFLGGQYP